MKKKMTIGKLKRAIGEDRLGEMQTYLDKHNGAKISRGTKIMRLADAFNIEPAVAKAVWLTYNLYLI